MPITKVWYVQAIGRSRDILKERKVYNLLSALTERKLLEHQFPGCRVEIIRSKEFIVKIEKKIKTPQMPKALRIIKQSTTLHINL
tara:strand:+ start:3584 stop:3838 length:255 start_codon:yes stop_codon:yes gene_type:complete